MVLAPGTSVAFDYGVLYRGYCSDFGRSAFVGEPNAEAVDAYRTITQASRAVMEEMGDGKITPAQICDFVAERVGAGGWGDYYMYMGLGHSIGLEVHEDPWLRPAFRDPIKTNAVFTVEPKVWKPGGFYVRCEDMVRVGSERGEVMTHFSYDPIVIT
jgi:Xaa-Pro aminopeptidase